MKHDIVASHRSGHGVQTACDRRDEENDGCMQPRIVILLKLCKSFWTKRSEVRFCVKSLRTESARETDG